MGGGDLNSKKSWHPNTIKNQERVWKAEQAEAEEKRRIMELQKERAEERDREDLNSIARNTAAQAQGDVRLNWMYEKPDKKGQAEDYLLGKSVDANFEPPPQDKEIPVITRRVAGASMVGGSGDTQVDLVRKMQEDPLLLVRERERAARAALLNNPIQRKKLTELLRQDQEKRKSKKSKKEKSKNSSIDNLLASKLNALGGKSGVDLAALLADDDSDTDSSEEEKKRKKKKKKTKDGKSKKDKKPKKADNSDSDNDLYRKVSKTMVNDRKISRREMSQSRDRSPIHHRVNKDRRQDDRDNVQRFNNYRQHTNKSQESDSESDYESNKNRREVRINSRSRDRHDNCNKPYNKYKKSHQYNSESDNESSKKKRKEVRTQDSQRISKEKHDNSKRPQNKHKKSQKRDSESDYESNKNRKNVSRRRSRERHDNTKKPQNKYSKSQQSGSESDFESNKNRKEVRIDQRSSERYNYSKTPSKNHNKSQQSDSESDYESNKNRKEVRIDRRSSDRYNYSKTPSNKHNKSQQSDSESDYEANENRKELRLDRRSRERHNDNKKPTNNTKRPLSQEHKSKARDIQKRVRLSSAEKAAKLAEMVQAGVENEAMRGKRILAQQIADKKEPVAKSRPMYASAQTLPDSLATRIQSNRHNIQRNKTHMNEHFARR